jgi:chaperonin GroES
MTPDTVQPLGTRVLIRVHEEDNVTASGLVIPDSAKERGQRGEVVAIGDDKEMIKVAVGEQVLYAKYGGTELRLGNADYLIMDASDLLAVLGPRAAEVDAA